MSHPSVAIVIYNKSSDSLVLVKQLRPAVLFAELVNDAGISSINDFDSVNKKLQSMIIFLGTSPFLKFITNIQISVQRLVRKE